MQDLFKLSLILRQFLVDGDNLVNKVNRRHRLKIRFIVGMSTSESEKEMKQLGIPEPMMHFLGAFPPKEQKNEINLDSFLSFQVVKHNKNHFCVKDLIKTCANKLGGVHLEAAKNDNETESGIRELGLLLEKIGLPNAFATLILIGNTTLIALEKLKDTITKNT
jgi:hypothetical protein